MIKVFAVVCCDAPDCQAQYDSRLVLRDGVLRPENKPKGWFVSLDSESVRCPAHAGARNILR